MPPKTDCLPPHAPLTALNADMGQPEFYQKPKDAITASQARMVDLEQSLAAAYARWEQLDAMQAGVAG
jgi:ATP-binding cassette subfamily F protein uup